MKLSQQSASFWSPPMLWRFGFTAMPRRTRIPRGFRPRAQGCEARATLGGVSKDFSQPQRGCGPATRDGHNPVRVVVYSRRFPRVARALQPWAGGHNPFRIAVEQMLPREHPPPFRPAKLR